MKNNLPMILIIIGAAVLFGGIFFAMWQDIGPRPTIKAFSAMAVVAVVMGFLLFSEK